MRKATKEHEPIMDVSPGLKVPDLMIENAVHDRNRGKAGPYKFLGMKLKMPAHDFDIRLIRPDGSSLLVQWRVDGETVDVCLCKNKDEDDTSAVYVYMADLSPAKREREDAPFQAQQITIMKEG
jgi:hypothetical protein